MITTVKARLSHKEAERLEHLYRAHAPRAAKLAYLLIGDVRLAEDLVQDAFVRVVSGFSRLRDPEAFSGYLRRTIVNLANSHFRRRRLERSVASERRRLSTDDPNPGMIARQDLWSALLHLKPRQRAALVLRYFEDLSEAEAAVALACRPGTVKSLVSRGLEGLRMVMKDE